MTFREYSPSHGSSWSSCVCCSLLTTGSFSHYTLGVGENLGRSKRELGEAMMGNSSVGIVGTCK